jgi:hypothetical protein
MLDNDGTQDWVVLNHGALDETFSYIPHDKVSIGRMRPEIVTDVTAQPLISSEIFALTKAR